tara:strand:- start:11472 stop:12455 length:984 start_codon:yes stop_codon:yes gene_type:complete
MQKKIRVAFIYKKSNIFLTGKHFDNTYYHFFMNALRRNDRIVVTYFPSDNIFDTNKLKGKFDIILLYENWNNNVPDELIGIKNVNIPVIARCGDFHATQRYDIISFHEKYNIDYYFGFSPQNYFYKFYPKEFNYKTIIFGLEKSLYENIKPFNDRIKNKILASGAISYTSLSYKFKTKFKKPSHGDPSFEYKLRTMCTKLPYVDYTSTLKHDYIGDRYPQLLQKYQAAIAATSNFPTIKYWEIPAAGCLTFMEITENNNGNYLGFIDNESAIFINENNYQRKFEEFINNPDSLKWEKIANQGRKHVFNNLNNDIAVNSLVDLMEKII